MKHVLVNQDGQQHATIMACPFKYKVPRGFSVHEDNPSMGKLPVDAYGDNEIKCQDEVDAHAMDFAVVRNGIIENVVQWGGAEWCPPYGTMLVPLQAWMGIGDSYNHNNDQFLINENRLGKADKNKSVAELESEGL